MKDLYIICSPNSKLSSQQLGSKYNNQGEKLLPHVDCDNLRWLIMPMQTMQLIMSINAV